MAVVALDAARSALYAADGDAVLEIQRWKRRTPLLRGVDALTSPHPLHDFSVVVWIVFLVALPFAGYHLFWAFVGNYAFLMLLSALVTTATPRQLDSRISSRSQVSPSGFPIIEIALAVVVFVGVAKATTDVVVWYGLVSVGVSLLVVKILSCSYFLHSIALSVALGWLGTTVAARCCAAMLPHDKSLHTASTAGTRLATAFFGLLALAAFVAHRVEQNEAPIMRVPKREFVRVIDLVQSGPPP